MTLKKQVCSLRQARRLKQLGVRQDSLFYIEGEEISTAEEILDLFKDQIDDSSFSYDNGRLIELAEAVFEEGKKSLSLEIYSAYTVAELAEMLPDLIETDTKQYELVFIKEDDCWLARYVRGNNLLDTLVTAAGKTLAECAAETIITLLQKQLTIIEHINIRLGNETK